MGNLRGDTKGGFAADAACPGVRLLSGFSPALLKLVLTGVEDDDEEVTVDGVSRARPTPYETMRKCLDAPRYDAVRGLHFHTSGGLCRRGSAASAFQDSFRGQRA